MVGMTKMGGYAQAFACGDASTSSAAIVRSSVCVLVSQLWQEFQSATDDVA